MSLNSFLLPDEDFTDLGRQNFQVLQKKQGFRFSIDAVLLAHFLTPEPYHTVLDIGTGCGVIPLLLLAQEPTLQIDALEIQPELADMAYRSMEYNRVADQIHIQHGDINTLSAANLQAYDYIYSNPPFFPVGSGKVSPNQQIALAKHELACTLAQLIEQSSRRLKPDGHLALVHRAQRLPELLSLCQQHHLAPVRLRFVHAQIDDPASLCLLEAVKGRAPQLTIMPPLVIYNEFQEYTPEVQQYYTKEK